MNFVEFTPRTLQQLISTLAGRLQRDLPELAGLVRVTGLLTDPGKPRGSWHYAVKITGEGGAQIKADLPASLVSARQAAAGSPVTVIGTLKLEATNYGLEARLVAGDLELAGAAGQEPPAPGQASVEMLKSLPGNRFPFPSLNNLTISLIQSSSVAAQVGSDCQSELDRIAEHVRVLPMRVNMLDPVAITQAINQATGGVVMVIRGGGDAADFEVFDHPAVVRAMAEKQAFRVVGLGHSGNMTLLDLVAADYSANTPAQAGQFVREVVESRLRQAANVQDRIKTVERERDEAIRRSGGGGVPWWSIAVALLAGLLAGWLLR